MQIYICKIDLRFLSKELGYQINWQREHVGVIILACNGVEGLQVSQLKGSW